MTEKSLETSNTAANDLNNSSGSATGSATDILEQLRGIQMPDVPPEPPVWPMLLAAAIIAFTALAMLLRSYLKRESWARDARLTLNHIKQNQSPDALLELASLLKRIALTNDRNPTIKRLSGKAWLSYLDGFYNTRYFSQGEGQVFGDALYRPASGHSKTVNTTTEINIDRVCQKLHKLIRQRSWQT